MAGAGGPAEPPKQNPYLPKRAPGLWTKPIATRAAVLQSLSGGAGGGRVFDEHGNLRVGGETFSASSQLSSIYRVNLPIGDREVSDRPYEENVWVRAAIKALRSGFLRLNLRFYSGDPEDQDATEILSHPLLDLLQSPNVLMTARQFWESHVVDMKLDGEQIWFLMDANGDPVASDEKTGQILEFPASILPVRGSFVEIEPDKNGFPKSYRYKVATTGGTRTGERIWLPSSVVHFRDYDPYNLTRGLGDVDSLARETDLYFQAFRSMDGAVRNGGDPGGFIIFDHEIAPLELDRIQGEVDQKFSGPNASRYRVLEAKAKFTPNFVKPSDMQYRELVQWLRDSILAGLGVPPPVVGIFDDATYNNVETAYRELFTGPNGVLSMAALSADIITNRLLPRLPVGSGVRSGENVVAYFDPSQVEALQDNIGEKLDRAAEIAAKGIGVSFNEAMELQGAVSENPEGGDRRWKSSGLTDLDDPEAGMPPQPEPQEAPAEDAEDDAEDADESGDGEDDGADDSSVQQSARSGSLGKGPVPTSSAHLTAVPADAVCLADAIEPDPKIQSRVLGWLAAFERDQIAKLRRLSNGGLRAYSALDEPFDPEGMTDEQWDALLLSQTVWAKRLDRDVRVALREVFMAAVAEAHGEVGGGIITATDPEVIQFLSTQQIKLAEGVTSTVSDRVRNAIARVMAGSRPSETLRDAVKDALPELTEELRRVFGNKEGRAATIAQTETGQAENGARFLQYGRSGVARVRWIASLDEATRASHAAVNGQEVEIGTTFSNGLRYPHDPVAPASQVINCRCTLRAAEFTNPLDALEAEMDAQ